MGVLYVSGDRPTVTVGRDPGCDLVLGGSFVSRRHLSIRRVSADVALVEVTGTNGAVVDRIKVKCGYRGYVRSGDSIVIGSYRIVWTGASPPEGGKFYPIRGRIPEPDMSPFEIEGPPARRVPEKPSVMLAAGPALTMAIPILLGVGRSVAILSSVFAAIWAVINVLGRVRKQKTEEVRRRNTYMSYLARCENTLKARLSGITEYLNRTYPEAGGYLKGGGDPFILGTGRMTEEGHIRVRTGKGVIASPLEIVIPKERFEGVDDSLKELPGKLKEKYNKVSSSPYLVTIEKGSVSVFILKDLRDREMFASFILQIAVSYSPKDVNIQLKTEKDIMRYYSWVTLLPHFLRKGAGNKEEAGGTVYITDEIKNAWEMSSAGAYSVLIFSDEADISAGALTVLNRGAPDIRYDTIPGKLSISYASQLAGIWEDHDRDEPIPAIAPFGRLIGETGGKDMGAFLEDTIKRNYDGNDITKELLAPIGITSKGRKTVLDLHEKGAGPHGLIAGTTGSGKSELLTTLILSLAMRYPPDKLAFFLIDYKGGGMSNLFSKIPHLIGSISNLSKAVSKRAMISLRSENLRRQRIFADCSVNNINDYTRLYEEGHVAEPLPHVLIIIDEFAELKKEEPEFMDCLISVSQTGRSLGMHLILATQKPSGVVDDRIRSNSGFRIALRLLDRADSMDILGLPDAASLNGRGRALLMTSNKEAPECFQSGYAMGSATDHGGEIRIYKDLLCEDEIICDEKGNGRRDEDVHSWYELVLEAICSVAAGRNNAKPSKLWLPELPEVISDEAAYAVFDDPYEQTYRRAVYDPASCGHLLISGRSGSGRSETVKSILWKMKSGRAVYVIDRAGGILKEIAGQPFCGGYVPCDDRENVLRMLLFVEEEISLRRKMTSDERSALPVIIIVAEEIGEIKRGAEGETETAELLLRILRTGAGVKVYLVATDRAEPDAGMAGYFDTILLLGDHDTYAASSILKVSPRDIPDISGNPGRGLGIWDGRVLEFQAVLTDTAIEETYPANGVVPKYPYVPQRPDLNDLFARVPPGTSFAALPVGFEYRTGKIYSLPLDRTGCILICGRPYSGRHTLLFNISLIASKLGIRCIRADDHETLMAANEENEGLTIVTVENMTALLEKFYSSESWEKYENKITLLFENRIRYERNEKRIVVIGLIDNEARGRFAGRKIFESMMRHPYGISLGGCLDENRILDYSYMSFSQMQKSLPRHNATVLKYDEKCFSGQVILPATINVDNSKR